MAGKIFVNYRRGDDPGNTGRLFDRLQEAFQPEQLFMDVDSIAPGLDFVRVLEEQVGQCDALLAVIGKGWLDARDDTGARRLDNPEDFVRIEIESALKQNKRVIPVLVGDTHMPRPEELPEAIRPLARRNAVRLSHERFRADAQGLIKALQRALEEVEALRQAHAEAERKRQEDAANARAQAQREAEEQARRDKEQARLTAIAGLSADQIGKAEELANWDFIKASESAQEFRDHLARFPGGVTERFARTRLEDLMWAGLGASPGLDQLGDFLAEFPQGTHAKTAADRRAALEQEQAEAEEALRRIEQQKVQRPSSAPARLIAPGRWRMVAGSAMALLLVGWIGLYQMGVPVWVPWTPRVEQVAQKGPKGERGPPGPAGPRGPAGPSGTVIRFVDGECRQACNVACEANERILSTYAFNAGGTFVFEEENRATFRPEQQGVVVTLRLACVPK
jgi:hypothetical protein